MKNKRHLTRQEEFDIMKLILDKFLWLGVGIIAYGFYRLINMTTDFALNMVIMLSGAIVLFIFIYVLMKEYNYAKN